MKNLLLHEIIKINDTEKQSILIELLIPYKKSLYTYYKDQFCRNEPILMVTSVSNASQYGKIISSDSFTEEICNWLDNDFCYDEDNEDFCEYETINFNSMPLKNLYPCQKYVTRHQANERK